MSVMTDRPTPASPKDEKTVLSLVPASDVEGEGPHFEALSAHPWLAIEPASLPSRRSWFKLRYRLGLYDRPARPMLSFRRGTQEIGWSLLPGPVLGRGEGLAIAPPGTTAVWISPVARKGRFQLHSGGDRANRHLGRFSPRVVRGQRPVLQRTRNLRSRLAAGSGTEFPLGEPTHAHG